MSIPIVFGLDNAVNTATIQLVPINDIKSALTTNSDGYEITWRENDQQKCRAFLDIDGTMASDTEQADFDAMDDAIKNVLNETDLGTPFSVMSASKYRNRDWKDKSIKHKLSYRITFTHKCGSKEAVKAWCRDEICPRLKEALNPTIPFFVKGVDTIPEDAGDYLDWDNGVYRTKGKMRLWNQTKPGENRKNVIVKGEVLDTLINYIPEDCETLAEPTQSVAVKVKTEVRTAVATAEPPAPITPEKALIQQLVEALPLSVCNDYNDWLKVGIACFNEELPFEVWDKWSSASPKYRAGDCKTKWASFRKSNISQAFLWSVLKREDPDKFKEMQKDRKDFIRLVEFPTHYAVAQYFYNIRPNDYLFDTASGWFGVTPTGVWEKSKTAPPTIKNKIVRVLNTERLQLEKVILSKKREASDRDDAEATEVLDKITKQCIEFRKCIESDGFQKGLISFLASFYAEQSQLLMNAKGVKESDGVIAVFDMNPDIFAFTDCLYDFSVKKFRPIDPTDYITITTGYAKPKPNPAVRKLILQTLTGIWEDEGPRDFVLTLLASCLSGRRYMEVFSILTGRGGNGKGLIWELVMRTFGGYYYALPKQVLTKSIDSATAATPDIANLRGMRCVGTSEPEAEERLQEGTIKLLTGGDPLTGRLLYGQPFTFKPQFGLFIQCNNIPVFNAITKGGVRRNRVIPFPFNFVGEPKLSYERQGDPHIKNVLCRSDEWRDEFFNILLEYYPKACGKQIDEIPTPPLIAERTAEYVEDNNRVGVWWAEHYEVAEGEFVSSREALNEFKEDTKLRLGEREFKAALAFNDIDIKKITRGAMKGKMGIENYRRKAEAVPTEEKSGDSGVEEVEAEK